MVPFEKQANSSEGCTIQTPDKQSLKGNGKAEDKMPNASRNESEGGTQPCRYWVREEHEWVHFLAQHFHDTVECGQGALGEEFSYNVHSEYEQKHFVRIEGFSQGLNKETKQKEGRFNDLIGCDARLHCWQPKYPHHQRGGRTESTADTNWIQENEELRTYHEASSWKSE